MVASYVCTSLLPFAEFPGQWTKIAAKVGHSASTVAKHALRSAGLTPVPINGHGGKRKDYLGDDGRQKLDELVAKLPKMDAAWYASAVSLIKNGDMDSIKAGVVQRTLTDVLSIRVKTTTPIYRE